jgi:hypothetical protein
MHRQTKQTPTGRSVCQQIEQHNAPPKNITFRSSYFNRIVNLCNFILRIAPSSTFLTLNSFKTFLYTVILTRNSYEQHLILTYPTLIHCAGRVIDIPNLYYLNL